MIRGGGDCPRPLHLGETLPLDPDLTERLKRRLPSLEPLLPKPVEKIDWATCHAANWRRSALSGTMEPVPSIEAMHLDDLLGIEPQKRVVEENTRQFLAGLPANSACVCVSPPLSVRGPSIASTFSMFPTPVLWFTPEPAVLPIKL